MKKLIVNHKNLSYPIFFKKGLLNDLFIVDFCLKLSNSIVIITHKSIENSLAKPILEKFRKKNIKVKLISFSDGEKNKSRKTKELIEEQMLKNNFTRKTLIIAIGGGIVLDMAGFIAATYMRGIPYVSIPTTLLAMVDASIGGKTAINSKYGKNLIGAIHHPKGVFMDFEVLENLANKETKNGLTEMLKHALILKKKYFYDLLSAEKITQDLIVESVKIKKEIIEKDENDLSFRNILNFGHTIAHALEMSLEYKISHGEAVAIGILVESFISYKMNFLPLKEFNEIKRFMEIKKLIPHFFKIPKDKFIDALKRDKKNIDSINRFTLLKNIGKSINNVEIIKNHVVNYMFFAYGGLNEG
ncbi:MAG: 3-dehydroquinate synthase [Candidatus Anoxychlamydiales bacterium]|nr:3-dehydroquinate synthase [Candidatus Anoxychlamydiales bacterium]NGX35503.1 3-dehydroquinate synthase [Candidatus Anoxychlamydiales bacterium]